MQEELENLRQENARLKAQLDALDTQHAHISKSNGESKSSHPWDGVGHGLSKDQIARYSRQIVLPSFGVQSQSRLCNGSILIVGAGGLGSPAAIYLAAAGVGRIGIVDKDTVELSNIHRQIIHTEASVGIHKVDSATTALHAINSSISIQTFKNGLTPQNALEIVEQFDVIIDASDNAPTRYLLSDACVVAGKPLVSGAAIGTDGQLTVYSYGDDGPCYRCLYPESPQPQNCQRCVDAGVLGIVPGIIGTMQALEAVKILARVGVPMSRKMLVMDAMSSRFHVVKLRAKSAACVVCGDMPSITKETLSGYDYASFTGQLPNDAPSAPLQLVPQEERVTVQHLYNELFPRGAEENGKSKGFVLIDVRPEEQFKICHISGSINAPWKVFHAHEDAIKTSLDLDSDKESGVGARQVYVVCRRGNDSQRAVHRLREIGLKNAVDVIGGVEKWAREIDATFPVY